jgi:AraC-like DNA-binding protein
MISEIAKSASFRFSTFDFPLESRLDVWRTYNALCEMQPVCRGNELLHYEHSEVPLGQFSFGSQRLAAGEERLDQCYSLRRTPSLIRNDGFDFYYVCLSVSAGILLEVDGQQVRLQPDQLFVLDIARPYCMQLTPGDVIVLTVPRALIVRRSTPLHGLMLDGHMSKVFAQVLSSLFNRINTLTLYELNHAAQATAALLLGMLAGESNDADAVWSDTDSSVMEKIKRYVDDNLQMPGLNQESICKQLGLSRSTLYRLFSEQGGVACYIRRCRLIRARTALIASPTTSRRISAIAYRCGFSSDTQFSRTFKSYFGYTPRECVEARHHVAPMQSKSGFSPVQDYSQWLRQHGL